MHATGRCPPSTPPSAPITRSQERARTRQLAGVSSDGSTHNLSTRPAERADATCRRDDGDCGCAVARTSWYSPARKAVTRKSWFPLRRSLCCHVMTGAPIGCSDGGGPESCFS